MTRFRIIVAAVCAAAVVLAGCEATDSFAHDPEKAKTRRGAGYGAAAGAVGNYMDKQEAKLRQQMAGTGVDVVRQGDNITLDVPGGVTFAFDSADLNSQFYPVLDKVAGTLKEYDKTVIEVAGHTDSVGSDTYNQGLSQRRATSVASYLSSHGVTGTRVVTIGAGEAHPVASNDTEEGRAQNRRVEITIVPVTQEAVEEAKQG